MGKVKQGRAQVEKAGQDRRCMPLLGPTRKCFGLPGLRSDWSIHTTKGRVLVSSTETLAKGFTWGRLWEAREGANHKATGWSHSRDLTVTCDSAGLPHSLMGGASVHCSYLSHINECLCSSLEWFSEILSNRKQ